MVSGEEAQLGGGVNGGWRWGLPTRLGCDLVLTSSPLQLSTLTPGPSP